MATPEEINGPSMIINDRPKIEEKPRTEDDIVAEYTKNKRPVPWVTDAKYIVSVDIGKQNDYTAIYLSRETARPT